MDGDEYPKAMYRSGGDQLIWGRPVQTIAVHSAEEQGEFVADGWRLHPAEPSPLDHDGDGRSGGSLPRRNRPLKLRSDDRADAN